MNTLDKSTKQKEETITSSELTKLAYKLVYAEKQIPNPMYKRVIIQTITSLESLAAIMERSEAHFCKGDAIQMGKAQIIIKLPVYEDSK